MRNKIAITVLLIAMSAVAFAQHPVEKSIRIVDTLSATEKTGRNPVLLKTELDSLVKLYAPVTIPGQTGEPLKETLYVSIPFLLPGLVIIVGLIGFIIFLFYRHHQKMSTAISGLSERSKEPVAAINGATLSKEKKGRISLQSLETKIADLDAELHKLSKENEGLNRVIKEYNGIQHEYDSLRHGILRAYKVKNYPGYDKTKHESVAMQAVLDTENTVAAYAYEKFLKPILAISDANKNSPARITKADQEKLLDLLVSLSLLYIEYLYLRVNDLSIGGKMVERIQSFSKGNGLDPSLLKKLNTEFGSRALVIKMTLEKANLNRLSYPVFDETNLNYQ